MSPFILAILLGVKLHPIVMLIFISWMTSGIKHLFMYFFAIWIFSQVKRLKSYAHFKISLCFFLLFSYVTYILGV